MYLTLTEIKSHLNIDTSFTSDDALLLAYGQAAEQSVERDIDCSLDEYANDKGEIPAPLHLACLMLTAHFYASREPVAYAVSVASIPYSVGYLITPFRRYASTDVHQSTNSQDQ